MGKACSKKGWCPGMTMALEGTPPNQKGISAILVFDFTKRVGTFMGVAYKRTAKDNPILFNVCPWCRAEINWSAEHTQKSKA